MSEVEQYLNELLERPNSEDGARMVTRSELKKLRGEARDLVARMFKDENGKPIVLTDTQCDIFNLIFKRLWPRCHIETFTRFGKSLTIALALLMRASTYPEKWAVVAGNDKQAGIIMGYVIQHIFDNDYTSGRYRMEKGETAESIQRHKSKDRINFVIKKEGTKMLLGEIFITNAKGALGFGAPNVVCFPAGTKVMTLDGNIEIEDIVDKRLPVKVASYNHETNEVEYRKIVGYLSNEHSEMVEVDFGSRKIVCTKDHPIFVEGKGYVKAIDLREDDIAWALD